MLLLIALSIVCGLVPASTAHDRPIVGVLVQEISQVFELMYPKTYDSFIAASYVKWVEGGGARVVPIWIGKDRNYYQKILSKVNGVLLPGGSVDKHLKGGYFEAAHHIVTIATDFNMRKDFFPIFGIGMGMDYLLYLTNNDTDISTECDLQSLSASLILVNKDSKRTALYNSSSLHIKKLMTTHPVSVLNSRKCYTKTNFEKSKLGKVWIPFSYNLAPNHQMIVSSVEHDYLPFYGTLFHPEKIPFEWAENTNFPHTLATIETSQFFANYFVNEARKSDHKFRSQKETLNLLIESFTPVFTAKAGSSYFQAYLFNRDLGL